MNIINPILLQLSNWVHPWLSELSLAFIATLLVVFGQRVNTALKAFTAGTHFILRTLAFIFLCAVGYGLLTVNLARWLHLGLDQLAYKWLGLVVILCFVGIGVLAERKS